MNLTSFRAQQWALLATPILIFLAHALLFRHWIVDDAGISFVYSRSLAQGHGLIAQPGDVPVEGYSNFLWVLLMAPFFALKAFDPILTPKLVGSALVVASFALIHATFRASGRKTWEATVALSLLSLNTSFVVWTTSGLENPLYVFFLCALLFLLARPLTLKSAALCGLLVAASAMTRPDGILFSLVPALFLVAPLARGQKKEPLIKLAAYGVTLAVVYGSFLAFRLLYFGDVVPNTYRMKGGPKIGDALAIVTLQPEMRQKAMEILNSVMPAGGLWLLAFFVGAILYLCRTHKLDRLTTVCAALCGSGFLCYMLLPMDWMDEYRFATPLETFAYLLLVLLLVPLVQQLQPHRQKLAVVGLATLATANGVGTVATRSRDFARNPTVPFDTVAQQFGWHFEKYAHTLGLREASVALPDVGGMLYYSHLHVIDTGGLIDRTVALTMGKNQKAFYDYIFDQQKPTFIHTHIPWSTRANFDGDPRFRRDYIPLQELRDVQGKFTPDKTIISGEYIRRDVASKNTHYPSLLKLISSSSPVSEGQPKGE